MNHVLTLQDLQGEVSGLGPTEVQRGKDLLTSLSEIEAMIAPIRQVFLKFRDLDAGIKKVKAAIVTAVTSMLRHLLAMTGDKLPIRSDLLHQLRDARNPPHQRVGRSMALSQLRSTSSVKANGPSSQCSSTREFDGHNEYCLMSITNDDDQIKCPNLAGLKREWTYWVLVTRINHHSTCVTQLSVATGLQNADGSFVPYDNYARTLHDADMEGMGDDTCKRFKATGVRAEELRLAMDSLMAKREALLSSTESFLKLVCHTLADEPSRCDYVPEH
ncbi:hypothetical protein DYB28_002513 [Aphanomyces astaci]|uniref:Uncharacterized protein n=1 Tax=Aphanomyces astaci TaxID=112090 RepID=A0A397CS30_APHAT|nr:hypothetical protein DYB36_003078 [Aphanomyces astaci]RHY18195.1 hypothetical protein DYB25_005367 [Aphanomyces astaci]RHY51808.1 hypothetical protein DYB30_003183 [Aphanomyces astaci]RHY54813.1 hypothetical protein DYB38_005552 [Aphanomyces astaci]RHY65373.1 hypothetical protein DYB34_006691 [Aphanomyces astaci]